MVIPVTKDVHLGDRIFGLIINLIVNPICYYPRKRYYKGKGIIGYFRGIKSETGLPGTSLITIKFLFPNRFEIFCTDGTIHWLGKRYKYSNNKFVGDYYQGIFSENPIANFGEHEMQLMLNRNPVRFYIRTIPKTAHDEPVHKWEMEKFEL